MIKKLDVKILRIEEGRWIVESYWSFPKDEFDEKLSEMLEKIELYGYIVLVFFKRFFVANEKTKTVETKDMFLFAKVMNINGTKNILTLKELEDFLSKTAYHKQDLKKLLKLEPYKKVNNGVEGN